ncbi:MAG: dihydropteroate synthase [Bacteroidetes bacterium]|nr:dihydropteroate synthase [Bacteroidota bacterium]
MNLQFKNKILDLSSPAVMGILNVTPDSFYDGGNYFSLSLGGRAGEGALLSHVEKMVFEGADIVDIGACSTRPNAKEVSEEEELKRLIPAIQLVRKKFADVIISADTFRSKVAEEAVNAGADMINDVSGGSGFMFYGLQSTVYGSTANQPETGNPVGNNSNGVNRKPETKMFETIAKLNVPYVLMHIQGTPQTMQKNPHYKDVVKEVKEYFKEKIGILEGWKDGRLIIDVGFGFGKTLEHNYTLLKHLAQFKEFGLPILAGLSRKSMISNATDPSPSLPKGERNARSSPPPSGGRGANGTTAANTIALMNGANILRVHDVKEAKEAVKIVNCMRAS